MPDCLEFRQVSLPVILLQKAEEDRGDKAEEGDDVVPLDGLVLEDKGADNGEDEEGDALLNHLELHKAERTAGDIASDAVGRNHCAVLEKGDGPGNYDYQYQRPVVVDMQFGQFQLPVPGECHKDVGYHQQKNRPKSLHFHLC